MSSCKSIRAQFSAYLDGCVTGVAMQSVASHLRSCNACAEEFGMWRQACGRMMSCKRTHIKDRLLKPPTVECESDCHHATGKRGQYK